MDILKLIILIIGAVLITIVGIIIKNKYNKKYYYTVKILEIANLLKLEISFNKSNIKEILQPFIDKNSCTELTDIFKEFLEKNKLNFNLLKENENIFINNFFNKIGETDLENTINNIEKFIIELTKISNSYREEYQKNGTLAFKLSVCLALVFMIFFA